MRIQRTPNGSHHGSHRSNLRVAPAPNASGVTIEVNKSLSIHLDLDEASRLTDEIHATLLVLASNANVQAGQLALFDSEA